MNNSPTSQRSKKRIRIDESANTKHGHTVNLHNDPDMSGQRPFYRFFMQDYVDVDRPQDGIIVYKICTMVTNFGPFKEDELVDEIQINFNTSTFTISDASVKWTGYLTSITVSDEPVKTQEEDQFVPKISQSDEENTQQSQQSSISSVDLTDLSGTFDNSLVDFE